MFFAIEYVKRGSVYGLLVDNNAFNRCAKEKDAVEDTFAVQVAKQSRTNALESENLFDSAQKPAYQRSSK